MTLPIRMVSVPVEPTEAMLVAPDEAGVGLYSREVFARIWSAMLTAAPVRGEGGAVDWEAKDQELIERGLRTIRTHDAVRYLREALSATAARLTGYDWNADPDGVTKQQGDAFAAADRVFADLDDAVASHPEIELPECQTCGGTGKIEEADRTTGANQHSACVRTCDDCDGCGFAPDDDPPALATREEAPDWTARTEAAWAENNREEAPADHISDARQMVEAPADAVEDDAGVIWRAAMTVACNIAIDEQNRTNDDDGPSDVLNAQGEIIRRIKGVLEIDDGYRAELSALRSRPQAREEAQPVAWRSRDLDAFDGGAWAVTTFKPSADVVEPLYTTPPAPEAEKLRAVTPELAAEFANIDGPWTRGKMEMEEVWSRLIDAQLEALAALQQEDHPDA